LWQVSRILSQHQQFVRNVSTEQGSVVMRMTVTRDGQLVDVGLVQSSSIPALDETALNLIRQAGPYPRLPPDIAGARHSFVLPLHFRRSN
jgi:protein TonB